MMKLRKMPLERFAIEYGLYRVKNQKGRGEYRKVWRRYLFLAPDTEYLVQKAQNEGITKIIS